jgi:2-polyprenyl-6-methoxyphenol hydroxylase-like FAD-dependent oxidoreductase
MMTNHSDVIIVGAGPTGLALANELALAGIDVRIVDRRLHEPNITRGCASTGCGGDRGPRSPGRDA